MTESGAFPRLLAVCLALLAAMPAPDPAAAQSPATPVITSPGEGDILKGQVAVSGLTDLPGFASAELAFAYVSDPTGTWFTIQTMSLPVAGGLIATWDTTAVTDGDYVLRLRVIFQDTSIQDAVVKVKVRNYTVVPTPTLAVTPTATVVLQVPTAIVIAASPTATIQPTPVIPTPTAIPPNPARVTSGEIFSGFWKGALVVGVLVLLFGALIRLRR
jgi:hypothetical protein